MPGPIVYTERDPSGERLLGLRLIGEGDEERWRADDDESADPAELIDRAAAWLVGRLSKPSDGIELLCIDPRGAACAWIDAAGGDTGVVRAATRQGRRGVWGDWPAPPSREAAETFHTSGAALDWRAASTQPLLSDPAPKPGRGASSVLARRGAAESDAATRTGVLAISDLPIRRLIDVLDARGVAIARTASLWHAMAAAWDPGFGDNPEQNDPLVVRDTSDSAVVLAEPGGRVQWAWSSNGSLVACGSSRLEVESLDDDGSARRSIGGRLGADWLAWSAQLGRSPGRVVCLVANDLGPADHAGTLGRSIGACWPSASVDLFRVEDPVDSTLRRLQETTAGGRPKRPLPVTAGVNELAGRPGRSHRAMYRWSAVALVLAAAALVVLGVRLRAGAEDASDRAAELVASQQGRVAEVLPESADLTYPALAAQTELDRLRNASPETDAIEPLRPVLHAVEQIAFAIGSNPDAQLESMTLMQSLLSVTVSGPDTRSVEFVPQTLEGGTDLFIWRPSEITQRQGRYQTTISGVWSDPQPAGAEPGT